MKNSFWFPEYTGFLVRAVLREIYDRWVYLDKQRFYDSTLFRQVVHDESQTRPGIATA